MAGLRDELMGALGSAGGADLLGRVAGPQADGAKTQRATALGLEAILGGLATNAQRGRGADELMNAVRGHDGTAVDDLAAQFGSPEATADGSKILGHVFGDKQEAVTQNLAAKSGLDVGAIAKMLPALAPVVMGMLGKKAAGGSLDAGGLAGMLKQESDGFDLGDMMDLLGGGGAGGAMGILSKLKGLFGGR